MATCATLEIQLCRRCEFGFTEYRTASSHDLTRFCAGHGRWRTLVGHLTFARALMAFTFGTIFLTKFNAQCRNFFNTDRCSVVTPGTENVGQSGCKIFIRQVAHTRHYAVVVNTVYGDRPREAK